MAKSANLKFAKPVSNGALKSDDLPQRIKILGWGKSPTLDGEVIFDEESQKVFYANQRKIGRTTAPLDFNHNTVPGTKAYEADKEPRHVAGYGVATIVPNDGLYYEYMQWTPHGSDSAKDYIDLSPAVITDEQNRVVGLHSCALTPAGAIENLSFYNAENMALYSADSMPTLMDKVACSYGSELREGDAHVQVRKGDSEGVMGNPKPNAMAADLKADNKSKYGNVDYADPSRNKYPIDTEAHVRAAWAYINMSKNQGGYSKEEISAIRNRIAAKASKLGIDIKAMSADKVQVDAYVTDPYGGINAMLEDYMDYFRNQLALPDSATPMDVMERLKKVYLAKWQGMNTKDTEPLPTATPDSSVDPTVRNDGKDPKKDVKTTITYTAEELAARKAKKREKRDEKYRKRYQGLVNSAIEQAVKPLSSELTTLRAEREQKTKDLDTEKRKNLKTQASRDGKVIPLSDEQIEQLPIAVFEALVSGLKPEVNFGVNRLATSTSALKIKPLSANPNPGLITDESLGHTPDVPVGTRDRVSQDIGRYFRTNGARQS